MLRGHFESGNKRKRPIMQANLITLFLFVLPCIRAELEICSHALNTFETFLEDFNVVKEIERRKRMFSGEKTEVTPGCKVLKELLKVVYKYEKFDGKRNKQGRPNSEVISDT